ncbi:hypothetical protein V6N11_019474 [Hibiscus sabdariffa]|uniref:RNase H type-1 domain-containing protein n=1 Tax=Hibiscus sabdariffa TaxID=183260 RepID=A0ABR2A7Y4_9ROSI
MLPPPESSQDDEIFHTPPESRLTPAFSDNCKDDRMVHSDCSEAVNLLTASYANNSPLSLVRAIDNLRQKGWATDIAWIPRACNKPADRLATTVDSRQLDLLCLTSPPTALISFC